MNVKRISAVFFPIDRLIENDDHVKLSVGFYQDVLLPVKDLFFDQVVVKWVVVEKSPINHWLIDYPANLLMNVIHFLLLRAQMEEFYHVYDCVVHCPLHYRIILFDRWVHEVTSEVED